MADYEKLGLISGVEIHQQLLTEKKLFCNCPAGKYTKVHNSEVLRHMRPTLSEFGTYDGTALMEFKTKKEITYLLNKESVCTYEMDDTPPFLVNEEALNIAIEIALMLNCNITDEMHIMRKQYLDGSIPTGFQRTAIVGMYGKIPYKDRSINITQLGFEEDSCREVLNRGHSISFRTDRLGMPLIEVVTEAQMKTPGEVGDVIKHIGNILRATGKVRRGAGSVRQDINVSIKGGSRVELKGIPSYRWAEKLVGVEALRQKALLEIKDILKKKNITKQTLKFRIEDLTKALHGTKFNLWNKTIQRGEKIKGIFLSDMADVLSYPVQPTKRFIDELRGRVRVIACLDKWPIIVSTNFFPDYYEGYLKDLNKIEKHFKVAHNQSDAILICAGSDEDITTAMNEILIRIYEAMEGVPCETRRGFSNGTSAFERILPGADRMYPDTDLPLTKILRSKVAKIKKMLKKRPWELSQKYSSFNVSQKLHEQIITSKRNDLINRLFEFDINPTVFIISLTETLVSLKRKGFNLNKVSDDKFYKLFSFFKEELFFKEHIPLLFISLSKGRSVKKAISDLKLDFSDDMKTQILDSVKKISNKLILKTTERGRFKDLDKKVLSQRNLQRKINFITGNVLKDINFRYSAEKVSKMVHKYLKEVGEL